MSQDLIGYLISAFLLSQGVYLSVRNILLLTKGFRTEAEIYYVRIGRNNETLVGPYIKYLTGRNVLVDMKIHALSFLALIEREDEDVIEWRKVKIICSRRWSKIFVVDTIYALYVLPAALLLPGIVLLYILHGPHF